MDEISLLALLTLRIPMEEEYGANAFAMHSAAIAACTG
jgi:hypothetical protein